jgi:methionyl-tRNA synthetase
VYKRKIRYYLLSEIPFAQDGSITYESLINKYNADLANTLGNLVNRCVAMANKYFGGKVTKPTAQDDLDTDLITTATTTVNDYIRLMDIYHNADALNAVMLLAKRCNKYIDETTPWILAKSEDTCGRLNDVLYNLMECIRYLGVLLSPFMPTTADSIMNQLQTPAELMTMDSILDEAFGKAAAYQVGNPTPLFARIDAEKMLAEIEAETPTPATPQEETKTAENVAFLPQISIDEFANIDLRVAEITDCEPIKKAKKLLKLTLNDGSGTPRTVCSGIAKWYTPDDLKGRHVILVANLKPAVLCGVESQGMILAADQGEDVKVLFVDDVNPGSTVR